MTVPNLLKLSDKTSSISKAFFFIVAPPAFFPYLQHCDIAQLLTLAHLCAYHALIVFLIFTNLKKICESVIYRFIFNEIYILFTFIHSHLFTFIHIHSCSFTFLEKFENLWFRRVVVLIKKTQIQWFLRKLKPLLFPTIFYYLQGVLKHSYFLFHL